jgi:hypothetical protein
MKTCEGCRYLFDGKISDLAVKFCRANPPTAVVLRHDAVKTEYQCWYPLMPTVRCGRFKRRWSWTWRRD